MKPPLCCYESLKPTRLKSKVRLRYPSGYLVFFLNIILTNNVQIEYVRKYASKDVFETADDDDDSDVDMSSVGSFDSEDEDGEAAGRLEV